MKLQIAIIEDEYFTRQAIKKYVEKIGEPYVCCGEAGNGQSGLELIREKRPDIALVDINMPIINGIDMIAKVRDEGLQTKMIILTGYSEFNYARTALKLNVSDYLLKPLRIEDLKASLDFIAKNIPSKPDRQQASDQLIDMLIDGNVVNAEAEWLMTCLDIPARCKYALILCARFRASDESKTFSLTQTLENLCQTLKQKNVFAIYTRDGRDGGCFVLFAENSSVLDGIVSGTSGFAQALVQSKLFFGTVCSELSELHASYNNAQRLALSHLFWNNESCAVYDCDFQEDMEYFDSKARTELRMLIEKGDLDEIENYLTKQIKACRNVSTEGIILRVGNMLSIIDELSLNTSENENVGMLLSLRDTNELFDYVLERARNAVKPKANASAHATLIRNVNAYIADNYSNCDLRITDIAKNCCISTHYLCDIYKAETGKTLRQVLRDIRMQHAERLLCSTAMGINEISFACGYSDPAYFCKSFQEYFGVTPKKYPDRNKYYNQQEE